MARTYDDDGILEVREIVSGFRLYHSKRDCFLATTFRSFPDYDGLKLNDTMLHELRAEFEVSCVQLASAQASTFYIVDGESGIPSRAPPDADDFEGIIRPSREIRSGSRIS